MVKKKKNEMKGASCGTGKGPCGGCAYGLGIIGAAVYYIGAANGFWMGVLGILKALVWPAMLVFELLKFVGA
jgi:hypothetical protein